MIVINPTNRMSTLKWGKITCHKFRRKFAPSMAAASTRSPGSVWSPAKKVIMANGMMYQIDWMMISHFTLLASTAKGSSVITSQSQEISPPRSNKSL